ncbi:hypothetical protein FRC04_001691 [Tulasnella sp. 424]|nr:hypothetical protein FRC04_001691 [Tulasnella sp. 424]KAG8975426.1 hypothetical protein FRC05_005756 [Tulasnella sp. 425]
MIDQTHPCPRIGTQEEAKRIWASSKQTFTAAKDWFKRSPAEASSQAAEPVGDSGVNGDTVHSPNTSALTRPVHETPERDPFGDAPSPEYAVEDPAVSISRRSSVGSAYSIATVAGDPVSSARQVSPTPSPNHSEEDDDEVSPERGSLFGAIVRRLSGTSPTAAAEEDLEMAIVLVRNPASRQSAVPTPRSRSPTLNSLTSTLTHCPPQITPSATLINESAPPADAEAESTQVKRKFPVETIVGSIACIVSVVGAVATTYATFHSS